MCLPWWQAHSILQRYRFSGQRVNPFVHGIAGMSFYPYPIDLVPGQFDIHLLPEINILELSMLAFLIAPFPILQPGGGTVKQIG